MQYAPPTIEWSAVMPVLIVILTGIVALMIEIIWPKRMHASVIAASVAGLFVAGAACIKLLEAPTLETFGAMVVQDRFGAVMQLILVLACALTFFFSESYMKEKRIPFGEFYPLVLWSTAGGMLMVATKHMLMIFVGLEILSIALYVLAGLSRNERRSEESALKYFLLGAFASAFLLYGMALLYGATGSLHLDAIGPAWSQAPATLRSLFVLGIGLALIGFGFKAALVPFHQWTPDVYQGAPTNVTAFMAVGSKVAAVATLYRFLDASAAMIDIWLPALIVIASVTMLVGNLVALVQKDVKRILAYSSIAHAGYILVAILAHVRRPDIIGFGTLAYYLIAYAFMTIGAFAIVGMAARSGREETRLQDLNGLWRRSPVSAILLVVFMASLIGVPPTAGFFGKLQIFFDAVQAGLMVPAIVLAVASAISVYYYLGIALAAFVAEPDPDAHAPAPLSAGIAFTAALCAGAVFLAAILFTPLNRALVGELPVTMVERR